MKKNILKFLLAITILSNMNIVAHADDNELTGIWDFVETIPLEPIYPTVQTIEVDPKMPEVREVDVNNHSGMKSWMPYNKFGESSNQYTLQQSAITDKDGFRCLNGRYMVAVGTAVNASVGQYMDIVLENGEIIPTIVSDIKADVDTLDDNITTASNGCVCEFIVDRKTLDSDVKKLGDTSAYDVTWNSPIIKFVLYEKLNFLGEE